MRRRIRRCVGVVGDLIGGVETVLMSVLGRVSSGTGQQAEADPGEDYT